MAHYAVGRRGEHLELLAVWQDSAGRYAEVVIQVGQEHLPVLRDIAANLEGLSESLWTSYAEDTLDVDSAVADVDDMLTTPEWPQGGYVAAYLDPLHEHSARLARAVAGLGDEVVSRTVRAEIDREFAALSRATLGDFGGRAGQATWRNRADASPTQVAAAHEVLRRHARGADTIDGLTDLEPAAACAALVSWCVAVAQVYADLSGRPAAGAARAAADVANLDANVMRAVLRGILTERRRPVDVVADMVPALDGRKLFGSARFRLLRPVGAGGAACADRRDRRTGGGGPAAVPSRRRHLVVAGPRQRRVPAGLAPGGGDGAGPAGRRGRGGLDLTPCPRRHSLTGSAGMACAAARRWVRMAGAQVMIPGGTGDGSIARSARLGGGSGREKPDA